jgi:hypothetical protein
MKHINNLTLFFLTILSFGSLQSQCPTLNYQISNYFGSQITCNGAADGVSDASSSSGIGTLNFNWSNGSTNSIISGLRAGVYYLSLTDASGCTQIDSITLTDPPLITFTTTYALTAFGYSLKCYGDSNGRVTSLATGGTDKILYTWSNGGNTAFQSNLSAGNYYVTATDANGCSASNSLEISQPPAMFTRVNAVAMVSVTGASNGSALATPIGGCPGYEFLWSNGQTNALAVNLSVGSYSVTVSDYYSCTNTGRVTILGPRSTGVGTSVSTGVSIGGGRTGNGGRMIYWEDDNNVVQENAKPLLPQSLNPYSTQNNIFAIKNLELYSNCRLAIYDLAGNLLFSDNNYQNDWIGLNNQNQMLSTGIYIAVLQYQSDDYQENLTQKFIFSNN